MLGSQHSAPLPCGQKEWHTLMKRLTCPKLRLPTVKIHHRSVCLDDFPGTAQGTQSEGFSPQIKSYLKLGGLRGWRKAITGNRGNTQKQREIDWFLTVLAAYSDFSSTHDVQISPGRCYGHRVTPLVTSYHVTCPPIMQFASVDLSCFRWSGSVADQVQVSAV